MHDQKASINQPYHCSTTTVTKSLAFMHGQQLDMQGSSGPFPQVVRRRWLNLQRKQAPSPMRKKTSPSHSAGIPIFEIACSPVPAIKRFVSQQEGSADGDSDFSMQYHGSLPTGADGHYGMLSCKSLTGILEGWQQQIEPQGALPRCSASAVEVDIQQQQQQQERMAVHASQPLIKASAQDPAAQKPGSPSSVGSQNSISNRSASAKELEGQQLQGPATGKDTSRTPPAHLL
jgi:hypothetical protein